MSCVIDAIPKIIHFTWKTDLLPPWNNVTSWRKLNPEFRILIWTDEKMAVFMARRLPILYKSWPNLKPVEQSDIFRYAVVYYFGGVYADIDVECLISISRWPCFLTVDGIIGVKDKNEMKLVRFTALKQMCQWGFAFNRHHELLWLAIKQVQMKINLNETDTLFKTGPGPFTEAVQQYRLYYPISNLVIYEPDAFAMGGYGNAKFPTNDTLVWHSFKWSWKG